MNEVLSNLSLPREEVSLTRGDLRGGEIAGVTPAALDEFLHDLRQPLGVIESLAYYLELTASEDSVRSHVQRIQAMLSQANRILERASACRADLARKFQA